MQSLYTDCKVSRVANSAIAGTTDVTSSVLDMAGWDGVVFVALLGDVTATSVLTLTAKENTANSTTTPTPSSVTNGATTAFTAAAADADNKLLMVDVIRPSKRYVFAVLSRTTANAVVDGIIAIQYRGRTLPAALDTTMLAAALSTPEV